MDEAARQAGGVAIEVPADYRMRHVSVRMRSVVVLSGLSMLALTAAQEPVGWSWLAWVALVPWLIGAVGAVKTGRWVVATYVLGLGYYLGNLYWLWGVTPLGYVALCFYLGWYFPLTGYVLRQVYYRRRWPFTFVLPVLWVGQEYLRGIVFTGFPWLLLGHSQHEHSGLIQICDVFGVGGLTFLVAMVNGLVCDLLLRPLKQGRNVGGRCLSASALALFTAVIVGGVVVYGLWRLEQGRETITEGPVVAVIQENIPQYVKEQSASGADIFDRHLALSRAALADGAIADAGDVVSGGQVGQPDGDGRGLSGVGVVGRPELIVWPETMCGALNREFLRLTIDSFDLSKLDEEGLAELNGFLQRSKDQDRQLRELAGEGVGVLVGASNLAYVLEGGVWKWNSAEFYLAGGRRCPRRYDKMHLVPFGEVVPFRESCPWLYGVLSSLTPYDYEYTLDSGKEPTVFELAGGGLEGPGHGSVGEAGQRKPWRFAVAICYEDVMPGVCRELAAVEAGVKRVGFLLNISNDGWFVTGGKDSPVKATSELMQHLVICKFRAVENRVGVARAVNTGISGFVRPDGRVQWGSLASGAEKSLADDPRERQAVAGFLTDRVMVDSRVTVYSRVGDVPALVVAVLAGLLLVDACRRQKRDVRQKVEG